MSIPLRGPAVGGYWLSFDDHCIVSYANAAGHRHLKLHGHFERAGAKSCVSFGGTAVTHTIYGFEFEDVAPQVDDQIFQADAVYNVTLEDAKIRISQFSLSTPPTNGLFDDPTSFTLSGCEVYVGRANGTTSSTIVNQTGTVQYDNRDLEAYPAGTQLIWARDQTDLAIKGDVNVYSDTASTVTAGNLAASNKHVKIGGGVVALGDGITAPGTVSGLAQLYIDTADGQLKVKDGSGTVEALTTTL